MKSIMKSIAKKLIALTLVLICVPSMFVFAQPNTVPTDKLKLVEDAYFIFEGKDNKYTAYIYCIFENTSDVTIEIKKSEINLTDAAGHPFLEKPTAIAASDYHPSVVHPGERTCFYKVITCKDVTDAALISKYAFNIIELKETTGENIYAESEPIYAFKPSSKGDYLAGSIAAKITNTSDAPHDHLWMQVIIRDQKGKLIYTFTDSSGRITLYPNSTIEYVLSFIPSDLTRVWVAKGIVPTTVESCCWFVVK